MIIVLYVLAGIVATLGPSSVGVSDTAAEMRVDLAIYTAPPRRSRAIDRYAKSAQLPPGSDEALMLEAMRAARPRRSGASIKRIVLNG